MSGPNASISDLTPACFTFFPTPIAFATCAGLRTSSIPARVCSCFVSATRLREWKDRDASRSPSCVMPLPMAGKSNPSSPCASKSVLSIDSREPSSAKTHAAGFSSPAAWLNPATRRPSTKSRIPRSLELLLFTIARPWKWRGRTELGLISADLGALGVCDQLAHPLEVVLVDQIEPACSASLDVGYRVQDFAGDFESSLKLVRCYWSFLS